MGQAEFNIDDDDDDLGASPSYPRLVSRSSQKNAQPGNRETAREKQDAREEGLRRELQTVRKVNEAIEGAIESLANARNSMQVRLQQIQWTRHWDLTASPPDHLHHSPLRLVSPANLDRHSLTDRAQPASDPQPILAWIQPRSR